jgi:hypothetical protein
MFGEILRRIFLRKKFNSLKIYGEIVSGSFLGIFVIVLSFFKVQVIF